MSYATIVDVEEMVESERSERSDRPDSPAPVLEVINGNARPNHNDPADAKARAAANG